MLLTSTDLMSVINRCYNNRSVGSHPCEYYCKKLSRRLYFTQNCGALPASPNWCTLNKLKFLRLSTYELKTQHFGGHFGLGSFRE